MKPWLQHIGRLSLVLVLAAGLSYCGGGDGDGGGTGPTGPPPDPQVVGPSGGTVSLLNGAVQISVPAGALSADVRLTAAVTTNFPASELVVSGSTIELGPTGTTFATPVSVTVAYDPSSLPAGVNESELRLRKVIGGEWEDPGDSSPNVAANTVTASVSSFSVFGVLGIEVDGVDVSPDEATIPVGGSQQFAAAAVGRGVTLPDRAITWSTVDPSVATVDDTGLVTAVAEGTTEVRAAHTTDGEEVVGSADIMVAIPVASVPVTPPASTINAGQTVQLTGQTLGPDDEDLMRSITWSSSNDAVATVDNTGLVSGLSGGTVTITAMSEGVSGTATVTVNDPVATVAVAPTTASLQVAETVQITATPTGATGNDLSGTGLTELWATDDAAVATVDQTGLVTAVGPGTADISVTIGGIVATATITVTVNPAAFVGSWVGTWSNTTFGSVGAAAWTIAIDESTGIVTLTTDLDGTVFGATDPLPERYMAQLGPNGVTFTAMSATFGDFTLTINSDGTMTGTGLNVPAAGIDEFTFTGTITPTQINLNYTVNFTGGGTAVGLLQVNKDATNQVPMAVALPSPNSIPTGDSNTTVVTIDGAMSLDGDGDPLTFEWDIGDGTLVNGTTNMDEAIQLTFPGIEPSTVTLTVNDGRGGLEQAQATITVLSAENQAPTAMVTADRTSVPAGDNNTTVVRIDASGSSDPDNDPLTFSWVVPSGTFVNGTTNTDEIIEVTFPGAAPYTVTVTVNDGRGGSDTASITITVGGGGLEQ